MTHICRVHALPVSGMCPAPARRPRSCVPASYIIGLVYMNFLTHLYANIYVWMNWILDLFLPQMWIFDTSDGDPRLLRFRNGHSAPPLCIRWYYFFCCFRTYFILTFIFQICFLLCLGLVGFLLAEKITEDWWCIYTVIFNLASFGTKIISCIPSLGVIGFVSFRKVNKYDPHIFIFKWSMSYIIHKGNQYDPRIFIF